MKLDDALLKLHLEKERLFSKKWQRSLPFCEAIFGDRNRFNRAKRLGFGEGASIHELSFVYGNVTVGKHTWIGPFTVLDGGGGLRIGDFVSVASGVQIYTHDTVNWALSGGRMESEKAPVSIGDKCYIGAGAVILRGAKIGGQCVIGAGAVVTKSLPAHSVAVGVPARIVGHVEFDGDGRPRIVLSGKRQMLVICLACGSKNVELIERSSKRDRFRCRSCGVFFRVPHP